MGAETNLIECEQTEAETVIEIQTKAKKECKDTPEEKGKIQLGVRALTTNPISACEKIDRMFGSGGEAIIHYMWLESGLNLFDNMIKHNPGKSPEELLKSLVDVQPSSGWGDASLKIIRSDLPMVDITVKNPPVKTIKGSPKYLIGSFWAGVLSRYFNQQLICKNFGYDADKDEFTCTVTI